MSDSPKDQAAPPSPDDPLALTELFKGGGEPWLPLLKPTIEAQAQAATFIGPKRAKSIVPVRELTFQALKPNPPEKWKVVVFGQNPYPRVESATGIAMFDNSFKAWKEGRFGSVTSMRCIIKAACTWKHGVDKKTPVSEIRELLAANDVVQPPEWFQAMLTQGVLLLNASLTASSDGSLATDQHTAFWRPVVEKLVEEILKAKLNADDKHKGVVFAWWGAHARGLRSLVERLQKKYGVPVRHIDHCNPAAQGDIFCNGNHFKDVNAALKALGMDEVDWLPAEGWHEELPAQQETAERMGDFITQTMELHKFYLDRLQGVKDEVQQELPAIVGLLATPLMDFAEAALPLVKLFKGLDHYVGRSVEFGQKNVGKPAAGTLTAHEIAALFLYTCESILYRQLNATLRDPDRTRIVPYFPYLRLFFAALGKLKGHTESLWRGVALDLRAQYPNGGTVVWWGVSSCTSKLAVAKGFLGGSGKRMLFEVTPVQAVGIRNFSAFTGEEEYILAPGTRLQVTDVATERSGLCTVKLEELADGRLVS
jgi:uracil DNA glycosylase